MNRGGLRSGTLTISRIGLIENRKAILPPDDPMMGKAHDNYK